MTREEEIINAAKTFEKKEGFSPIVMKAKGVNSAVGIGFLEGAVWQKEQMMKDAVETTVSSMVHQLIVTDYIIINAEQFGLKKGDKIKVLIIKED